MIVALFDESSAAPYLKACINTASSCELALHVETADEVVMSIVYFAVTSAVLQVPYSYGLVISCTEQVLAVRMEH